MKFRIEVLNRVIASIFLLLALLQTIIIVLSAFFAFSSTVIAQKATKNNEQKVIYTCPSHPDEMNPTSGKCPKCGMDMTENKQ